MPPDKTAASNPCLSVRHPFFPLPFACGQWDFEPSPVAHWHLKTNASANSAMTASPPGSRLFQQLLLSYNLILYRTFETSVNILRHSMPPFSHHSPVHCESSPAPFAKSHLRCFPLLRSSFLLMKWRSLRSLPGADFPASTKSAPQKGTVNHGISSPDSTILVVAHRQPKVIVIIVHILTDRYLLAVRNRP